MKQRPQSDLPFSFFFSFPPNFLRTEESKTEGMLWLFLRESDSLALNTNCFSQSSLSLSRPRIPFFALVISHTAAPCVGVREKTWRACVCVCTWEGFEQFQTSCRSKIPSCLTFVSTTIDLLLDIG